MQSKQRSVLYRRAIAASATVTAAVTLTACAGLGQPPNAAPPATVTQTVPAPPATTEPTTEPSQETSTSEPVESTTTASAVEPCRADQLEARINPGTLADLPQSDSAGYTTTAIELTNTSTLACTVTGFGAFTMLDAQGQPLPTNRLHTGQAQSDKVTVQPDSTVGKSLEWTIFPNAPESGCYEASGIRVEPSGEGDTEHLTIPWRLGAYCSAFNDGPFLPA